MNDIKDRLDVIVQNTMSGLKDFQRATVDRVIELFSSGTTRVLVSDEVGLGKTLIARGTVARLAELRKSQGDDLVKVVYVCSNAAIAEQNLAKLKITPELDDGHASISSQRLSMQHLNIAMQESDERIKNNYIQLIPLTPDTSFRLTRRTGTASERALMLAVVKRLEPFCEHARALDELFRIGVKEWNWQWYKNYYDEQVRDCDARTNGKYMSDMTKGLERELAERQADGISCRDEIIAVTQRIERGEDCKRESRAVVVKLRRIFARLSLEKLDPDLVIMDEFQRFKFLLAADKESETGMLAAKFFGNPETRMLLLSATPYKMYSTLDEIEQGDDGDAYSEFLQVMKFLNVTDDSDTAFRKVWSDYSTELKEYSMGRTAAISAKRAAENALYSHVCRTERMAAVGAAETVSGTDIDKRLEVTVADILSYTRMSKLLRGIVRYGVPDDYVKSCPYLLSFMRDYKLKRDVEAYFKTHADALDKLRGTDTLFVDRAALAAYKPIACNNARLDDLMKRVLGHGAELLLWVPPSKPYYPPEPPFDGAPNFSKTLVFSAWEMVPRMIASLVSYEVERKTIGELAKHENKDIRYFANDSDDNETTSAKRHYPLPKLNFKLKDGEPAAMSLFCLVYPSAFLAECYDPIGCLNARMTASDIARSVGQKISIALDAFESADGGIEDRSWYYVAPLLLDGAEHVESYARSMIAAIEADETETDKKGYVAYFVKLGELARAISQGTLTLGKRPTDLVDVLADMAIASPAVCALRGYGARFENVDPVYPTQFARAFVNRMRTPESTAAVELCFGVKNEDAYWRNVLAYCRAGNFQAMTDEYLHLLTGGVDTSDKDTLAIVHADVLHSLDINTTKYNIDTLGEFKARAHGVKTAVTPMRSHFAVAFTKGDGNNKDSDRKKTLRNAFNSPFRPFVLASTSIGQEGLDFHNYCRRIVHWNLPSNPIDLEQREGRINRYECLAIRQNVAARYGDIEFVGRDVWREMFEKAQRTECDENTSELVPYWSLTGELDVKIERVVPMYPYSKDEPTYRRLMKILSLYRLTLGQTSQEELLEYIMQNRDGAEDIDDWFIDLSPYRKRTTT